MRSNALVFWFSMLILLSAAPAGAVSFSVTSNGATQIFMPGIGETITLTLTLDASDLTTETTMGWGISIAIDPAAWSVVGGTQVPVAMPSDFNGVPFGGINLLSPLPPNNTLDPNVIHVGIWGSPIAADPTNCSGEGVCDMAWGVQDIATIQLLSLQPWVGVIPPIFAFGDGFDANGVQIDDSIALNGLTVFVPEPGPVLLIGLGLAGLAATGRRKVV